MQPRFAQYAVDVDRPAHARDPVLREHDDARAVLLDVLDQLPANRVDRAEIARQLRIARAEPLEVVVEVRQVDERERRVPRVVEVQRAVGDPARRRDVGARTPVVEQREDAELRVQLVAQRHRLRVDVGDLAPVGGIHRARRDGVVRAAVHVVPPEELRAGEARVGAARRVPDLLAGDEVVRLLPEPHLRRVAEEPAVGHRAVIAREQPGGERRVHRAGHRGEHGAQRPQSAARGEGAEMWRVVADQIARQADDEQGDGTSHAAATPAEDLASDSPRGSAAARRRRGAAPTSNFGDWPRKAIGLW